MIASGGLTFDDIPNDSSEDESSKSPACQHSNRSDTSDSSGENMAGAIPIINDQEYISMVNKKKMVMSEIKKNVNFHHSSDSERETEINQELENYDYRYGVTPPREIRRNKQKGKDIIKFNSGITIKKLDKKQLHKSERCFSSLMTQKSRDQQRREKFQYAKDMGSSSEGDAYRSTKLVRVNSAKSLKSISQQNSIRSSHLEELPSIAPSVVTKTLSIQNKSNDSSITSSRVHFHKSFSLLVKLGGRVPSLHKSLDYQAHDDIDDQFLKEYPTFEVLWLELQAWHNGCSFEEYDNFLANERANVYSVLDKVINFKFEEDSSEDQFNEKQEIQALEVDDYEYCSDEEHVEEYVLFTSEHNMKASTTARDKQTSRIAETDHATDIGFGNVDPLLDNSVDMNVKYKNCGEASLGENGAGIDTDAQSNNITQIVAEKFIPIKIQQVKAMTVITELLKKLEGVEKLYPDLKTLTNANPKYKDVKFVRNLEAMVLWLNICKDMYHKLYLVADWIDIDPDDIVTWKDWFDIGLDFPCLKNNQCYKNHHYFSTSDLLESSGNLNSLSNNYATRRSKRDKRKRISLQRYSYIEKTSTSRYRTFIEREIRVGGLLGLIKRLKVILSATMWKARFTLAEMNGKERIPALNQEGHATHFEDDLKRVIQSLMKFSSASVEDYTFFDARIFVCENKWAKACQDMNLPSFLNNYLFLIKVPFDLTQESIRFRLDYKPKVEPSEHSIRQLIQECKEVVSGGILAKKYFEDMTFSVLSADDKENRKWIEKAMDEFNDDLNSMINLYFDYLQNWFNILLKLKQSSEALKFVMEEEWQFVKEMCPFVQGCEARAAYKFCVLVSNLFKSTGEYLECAVDKCFSTHNPKEDDGAFQRQKMSSACREYKEMFKEVRGKATKALAFAKLLQKELGIASSFLITTSVDDVFQVLKESGHVLLEYAHTRFMIFLPQSLTKHRRECIRLISLTCGFESPEGSSVWRGRYILLVKKANNKSFWKGRRMTFDMSPEVTLALSYIKKVEGVTLICKNAYHLNTQRKEIENLFGMCISIKEEQTSSNGIICKSLIKMKDVVQKLADIIVTAVQHVGENLDLSAASEMDEADRNSIHKACIETMHSCFAVGFEYLREMIRLFHGRNRNDLGHFLVNFSKLWIKFVMTKTKRGHGTRPRWAAQGMEFLVTVIDPSNIEGLSEQEFKILKNEMQDCIAHIIGNAEPRQKLKVKEQRSSSPFSLLRSRSVPPSAPKKIDTLEVPIGSVTLPADLGKTNDAPTLIEALNVTPTSGNSSATSLTLDSDVVDASVEDEEETEQNNLPIIRVRSALQEIDERRAAKLQHLRVIGIVTNKQANFASQLVHMNVRRVNFKWQLGIKIGEGQFGKVYSAVNLDTGELMAVKQIRFNPHDYGTIQEIADEITNIQGVQHNTLVKYFGVEVHKDEMLIFMENCGDGTIAEVAKLGLPESMIRVYTYQIVKAINFLHQNGIIHRDLKGANIFLSSSGLIKIGDFGSAVKLKDAMCTSVGEVFNTRGTAAFMAPEVITLDKGRGYGRAADIWSLGCVVIEMATGKQPWSEYDNIYAIMYKVGDGQHPHLPEHLSDEGKHFLKVCFIHDPNERWTAHMLEDHLFVKVPTLTE